MKREAAIIAFLAGTALSIFAAEPSQNADWTVVKQTSGVTIYSRPHAGSKLKEFKAVGEIDAPTKAVHNVIDDFEEYPKFMPFTVECRLVKKEGDAMIGYQRLSPKIVSDRGNRSTARPMTSLTPWTGLPLSPASTNFSGN